MWKSHEGVWHKNTFFPTECTQHRTQFFFACLRNSCNEDARLLAKEYSHWLACHCHSVQFISLTLPDPTTVFFFWPWSKTICLDATENCFCGCGWFGGVKRSSGRRKYCRFSEQQVHTIKTICNRINFYLCTPFIKKGFLCYLPDYGDLMTHNVEIHCLFECQNLGDKNLPVISVVINLGTIQCKSVNLPLFRKNKALHFHMSSLPHRKNVFFVRWAFTGGT